MSNGGEIPLSLTVAAMMDAGLWVRAAAAPIITAAAAPPAPTTLDARA